MTSEPLPQVTSGLISRVLDGNTVIVAPHVGKVRILNPVGSFIWQLLNEGQSRTQIESHLSQKYAISAEQAQQDLETFLTDLKQRGLLV